jgi:hypothetical protein
VNVAQLAATALAYFALTFGAGFLLGTVRVLWLAPQFGARAAEIAEAPIMLLVVYFAARWVIKRFAVPPAAAARLTIGMLALACLLLVEFTVVLWLQGITIRESIANRDPVSGTVYAASLVLFALMPLILSGLRQTPVTGD